MSEHLVEENVEKWKKIVSARCSLKIQAVQLMVVQGFVVDSWEIETHILRMDVTDVHQAKCNVTSQKVQASLIMPPNKV